MNQLWKFAALLIILISIGYFYFFPWDSLKTSLLSVAWAWVLLAWVLNVGAFSMFAARWRVLIAQPARRSWAVQCQISAYVVSAHNIFPFLGAAGNATALALLIERGGLSKEDAAALLAIDTILTGVIRTTFVAATAVVVTTSPISSSQYTTFLLPAIAAASAVLIFALARLKPHLDIWSQRRAYPFGKIASAAQVISHRLDALRSNKILAQSVIIEVVTKILEFGVVVAVQQAVGIPTSFALTLAVMAAVYVVNSVSVLPGNLGLYEGTVAAIYVAAGISLSTALLAAIIQHAIVLSIACIGLAIPYFARR